MFLENLPTAEGKSAGTRRLEVHVRQQRLLTRLHDGGEFLRNIP